MTPERWQYVQEVFEEALKQERAHRDEFLDEVCANDPDLRNEVASLLDHFEETGPMDDLANELVNPLVASLHNDPIEGREIGTYRVLRKIGQGGMGAVYLAERADGQFEQQVALKLIRQGMYTEELRHRFLNERRILAQLTHPHIARLLDGGLTASGHGEIGGQPFFAMEYIEGVPINQYCDRERLNVTQRLSLFQGVCAAVQYAHQNLIVHRDLKPSNILVTDDGQVKLLDFGIAKLLDPDRPGAGMQQTYTGRVMTPEYASPEQVRGEPVTTASDVYALGVVLYELLTGHRPYRVDTLSMGEVERVICEKDPVRPSTAVKRVEEVATTAGETRTITPEEVSHARATLPEKLRRRLTGDLDTMVMRALHKEPTRRYASAEQFLDDIKRHLAGLPVQAQPDTFGYRASKFIRRHRVWVGAAGLIMLSLLGGLAGIAWQARVASAERDLARLEAAKSQEVSAFLIALFRVADPNQARGDTITALELLDQGAERVEALDGQPEVQATMMTVMGQVYRNLGRYDQAQPLLEEALALRRGLPASPLGLSETLHHLGVLHAVKMEHDTAQPLLQESITLRREQQDTDPALLAMSLHELAEVLRKQRVLPEAEALYREALALRRAAVEVSDLAIAATLHNLAVVRHDQGDYAQAESLFQEVVALHRASPDEVDPSMAASLMFLAQFKHFRGDIEGAEPLYREALALRRKLYGDEHADVAESALGVAEVLRYKGDHTGAEPLYLEALATYTTVHGDAHPTTGIALNTFADFLQGTGQHDEALQAYEKVLAIYRAHGGELQIREVSVLNDLGKLYRQANDLEAAEQHYRESLRMGRRLFENGHPYTALSLHGLGLIAHTRSRYADADTLYRQAITMGEKMLRPDHPYLARFRNDLDRLQQDTAATQ